MGVIAILIGILLPVLAGVRRQANEVKCKANLRSLGQALAMYNLTTGYYPGLYIGTPPGWYAAWPTRLRPFLNNNRDAFLCPSRDAERFAWTEKLGTMGPAPAWTEPYGYVPGELLVGATTPFSYGYNGTTNLGLGGDVGPRGREFYGIAEIKVTLVRKPAEMIAIGDSQGDAVSDPALSWGKGDEGGSCPPGTIHRDGANLLFCDGHVEWYRSSEITVSGRAGTPWGESPYREILALWQRNHNGL